MNERTTKAALVSMEEWNAIHDEIRKAIAFPEDSPLSADDFRAAAQLVEPLSSD